MRARRGFRAGVIEFHAALDRAISGVLALLMAGSVLNVLWQIVSRYALGDPSPWTDELARYLLMWFGILGSAAALGRNAHLAVDLLPGKLPGPFLACLDIAVDFLVGAFSAAVLIFGGSQLVKMSFDLGQYSPAMGLPMGAVYAVIPIAGVLMVSFSLHSLVLRAGPGGGSLDA